jgi:hypothetical protein
MKRDKLKTPEDYEIFSFRTTQPEKDALKTEIGSVTDFYNRKLKDGERKWRKNDVIMEALRIGLKELKRKRQV